MKTDFNTNAIADYKKELERILKEEIKTDRIMFSNLNYKTNTMFLFRQVGLNAVGDLQVEFYRRGSGFQILNPAQHIHSQEEELALYAALYNTLSEYAKEWWDVEFDMTTERGQYHFLFRFYMGNKENNAYGDMTSHHIDNRGTSWIATFNPNHKVSSKGLTDNFAFGVNVIDGWFNQLVDKNTYKVTHHTLAE